MVKQPEVIINNDVGYTQKGSDIIIWKNYGSSTWDKVRLGSGVKRMRLQASELKAIVEDVYNINIQELLYGKNTLPGTDYFLSKMAEAQEKTNLKEAEQ